MGYDSLWQTINWKGVAPMEKFTVTKYLMDLT